MAVSFHQATSPPLFLHHLDGADPEVTDALLGFVYDPAGAGIDAFLDLGPALPDHDDLRCAKWPRAGRGDAWLDLDFPAVVGQPWGNGGCGQRQAPVALPEFLTDFVMPLPPPSPPQMPSPAFVRGAEADAKKAEGNGRAQPAPSAVARQRRKRISEKTAQLSRLVPGGHRLNTAEMLQEAGRHVKLLQAQVGVLALMRTVEEKIIAPSMAQEQMHALLAHGGVQERLAAEGKCLVPRTLVDAMAKDAAVESNAPLSRDLARFAESLPEQ